MRKSRIQRAGTGLLVLALLLTASVAQAAQTVTLYVTDAQGTVVAQMTPQGAGQPDQVTYTAAYRPYGTQVLGTPQDGPGYTGHVNDADSGLVYMQQRYYDPESQRFASVDPVVPAPGNVFNFNRYDYANNNPIINIDPLGTQTQYISPGNSEEEKERAREERDRQGNAGGNQYLCDAPECNEGRAKNREILRNQGVALKQAGIISAKFAAINFIGDGIGRIVGKLGRFFGLAAEGDAAVVFRSDTSHIFRNAPGHLAEDTAENRALLRAAVKPDNFIGTRGPGGSIHVYQEALPDGRQVWVEVRNGTQITNGGVNGVP